MLRRFAAVSTIVFLTCLLPFMARAQEAFQWTGEPKNLQVFPKHWPISRLRAPMVGFSDALGVSCSHCHDGVEGQPLGTYDFASDANPNKDRAREMLRMLGSINDHLDKLTPSGSKRVNMWCHTCHRGRPRPTTLAEELTEALESGGVDGALVRYQALRSEYYGKGVYDFESESPLNTLGYQVLGSGDTTGAIRIFRLNADRFPGSGNVWDSLAEAYLKSGDKILAERFYGKSLELDPSNRNARDQLKALSAREP